MALIRRASLAVLLTAALAGCQTRQAISAADLGAYVGFLASDSLEGRETGTPGVAEAERYIAGQFSRDGLKPLPGRSGYFLDFTLYRHNYDPRETHLELARGDERLAAEMGVDFRPFWFSKKGAVKAPVVFAGYGITAPEDHWDDYRGLDVKGKVVLVLRHEPGHEEPAGPFAGKDYTRHAFFVTKARNAASHGAVGMLLFTDPAFHPSGADDLRVDGTLSLDREPRSAGSAGEVAILAAQVSRDLARRLVRPSGYTLEGLQSAIDSGTRPAEVDLGGLTASLSLGGPSAKADEVAARDVAAFLPGRDPRRADQWIVIGAHHDHLGAIPTTSGDGIYNGADDNASGTSGVLELARRFASMRPRPARSLVFVTFSAEEEGLFGSRALFERDLLPAGHVVFMVNLDMIGRNPQEPVRVFASGADDQVMRDMTASAEALDLKMSFVGPASEPANSDYGPFADHGIPYLFFFTGEHEDYHEVSDEADKLSYRRMAQLLRLVAETIEAVADRPRSGLRSPTSP